MVTKTIEEKDFFNNNRFLKLDKNYFLWLNNSKQNTVVINLIPFCHSSSELIDFIAYSNNDFRFENTETIFFPSG